MTSAFYPVPPRAARRATALEATTLDKVGVDVPVSDCIQGDRYPGKIVSFSPSRKTVVVKLDRDEELRTYTWRHASQRFREKGCDVGSLLVGEARSYMTPEV